VTERDERVERAQTHYPATWLRIRSMCLFYSVAFDVDAHVAAIVLATKEGRT
jgi:hypothetical protein